jgi:hypothetical protein
MAFRSLHERFKNTVLNPSGYLVGFAILSATFKPCPAQTGFNFDIRSQDEAAWLKSKIGLDEFQCQQIKKIEVEYHSRILYSIRAYASDRNKKQMMLHVAMAFTDHHERIKELLGKKQNKKWNDIMNKSREATRKRLMKYQDDDGTGVNR